MTSQEQLRNVVGTTAYDRDGNKLGQIGQVYFDDDTDQPKWITVNTGLFGMNESFVPLQGAQFGGDRVTVAYDKATIKDAPNVSGEQHLDFDEEQRLYRHYGLDYGSNQVGERAGRHVRDSAAGAGRDVGERTEGYDDTAGYDTSGPNTDTAMTRSEERLRAGTETQEIGRARLRKHVVTEHEQVTVPVSREEVRVEREPITEADRGAAQDGPAISEEEHEVTLHAERPVVTTEAEPVERVRLGTETVQDQETVGGEVRKEQIELDDDSGTGRRENRR
ncbi:MAG: PRC and DUF2382 domain-containing protein [Pseudonocardia sp.]|nr:PRC and DUF2382 domain-containing protein [Pseudonocardia sp.]